MAQISILACFKAHRQNNMYVRLMITWKLFQLVNLKLINKLILCGSTHAFLMSQIDMICIVYKCVVYSYQTLEYFTFPNPLNK